MRKLIKRLVCKHKWEFRGFEFYDPIAHGLKKPLYMCTHCGKMKFKELYEKIINVVP